MPDKQPDISTYSATDLMRYAMGHMPAAEMHAMEKAALEDPFLAEALEGYMDAIGSQPAAIIAAQAGRLAPVVEIEERKEKAVIIPFWKRSGLRIAVAALLVVGAGWAVFSVLQKPVAPTNNMAQQPPVTQPVGTDSFSIVKESIPPPGTDSPMVYADIAIPKKENTSPSSASAAPASGTVAMARSEPAKDFTPSAAPFSLQKAARADTTIQDVALANTETESREEKAGARMAMRQMQAPEHVFKGQITDAKNNPVPYANVMIDGQDFGTYSDVSGHFNFLSDDSVLRIRVRSVGYTNQAAALHTGPAEAHIVLQEDQLLTNSLPLTVQRKNKVEPFAKKSIVERDSLIGLEASNLNAPYYDLYLLNNNRISPLPTQNRQVEIGFDVSKTGEATNITVLKSSGGKAMDEEAVRLVKEGPKLTTDTTSGKKKKVTVRF